MQQRLSLLAGWLNQEQQKILEYLQEENRVLKAQLGQRFTLERRAVVPSIYSSARTELD